MWHKKRFRIELGFFWIYEDLVADQQTLNQFSLRTVLLVDLVREIIYQWEVSNENSHLMIWTWLNITDLTRWYGPRTLRWAENLNGKILAYIQDLHFLNYKNRLHQYNDILQNLTPFYWTNRLTSFTHLRCVSTKSPSEEISNRREASFAAVNWRIWGSTWFRGLSSWILLPDNFPFPCMWILPSDKVCHTWRARGSIPFVSYKNANTRSCPDSLSKFSTSSCANHLEIFRNI